jgi:hypothetical protein
MLTDVSLAAELLGRRPGSGPHGSPQVIDEALARHRRSIFDMNSGSFITPPWMGAANANGLPDLGTIIMMDFSTP